LSGKCDCYSLYYGSYCQYFWGDDSSWLKMFWFYVSLQIIVHSILLFLSSYRLFLALRVAIKTNKRIFSYNTYGLGFIVPAEILRVVYYAVDPNSFRNIIPVAIGSILFNIPILIWIDVGFLMLLFWVEVQKFTGVKELQSVSRLRPVLIALIICTGVVILPIGIWQGVISSILSTAIYNGLILITVATEFIFGLIFGRRLMKIISDIWVSSREYQFKMYLKKITQLLFGSGLSVLFLVIILIFFTIFIQNKWAWVIFHSALSLGEFGTVLSMTLFLGKTKPIELIDLDF